MQRNNTKNTTGSSASVSTPKKTCTKGDVTVAGPRVSVYEQLVAIHEDLKQLRGLIDKVLEEDATEGSDVDSDEDTAELSE